jgi:hypothetical protein
MKAVINLIIITILIVSGFGAVAFSEKEIDKYNEINDSVSLSQPNIIYLNQYVSLKLDEATSYTLETGLPMLPKITKTYELPIGSIVKEVSVKISQEAKIKLLKDIEPAPQPVIDGTDIVVKSNSKISNFDNTVYPEKRFTYKTSTGISGDRRVIFLSVHIYPIQYNFKDSSIYYIDSFEVDISYQPPENPVTFSKGYDMMIISPDDFTEELTPLVNHKINMGLNTQLKTLDEIYSEYPDGRDDAEKVKLFIYDAIDPNGLNLSIDFVLLVGGMVGQSDEWYLPVRYVSTPSEAAFLCDLYFADIYKDDGTTFDDWDSNGNNIIGEWRGFNKDLIDGSPDVYVGRLACRSESEVTTMVNKIIDYEETKAADSWYKNMILIGGDTYPDIGPAGAYEAEIDNDVSAGYMDDFTPVRLWASLETLTGQKSVVDEINNGAGFVHMAGHANPSILVTHPPDSLKTEKITIMKMYAIPPVDAIWALINGRSMKKVLEYLFSPINPRLRNSGKLPVIVIGGCHNSQFNTSIYSIQREGFTHAYGYGHHVPKCFSWWLTSKVNGGAIATIGNSGYGMGIPGFNYPTGLDGWLLPRFFYHVGQMDEQYCGVAQSNAITDYVNEFDINLVADDRQMVEQWILLGDPSLYFGGYE